MNIQEAVDLLENERDAMDELLDKAGWERHVHSGLRQDTGINLVVFSRRSDPEWEYHSQGGHWDYSFIDYDQDDCSWMSYDKEGTVIAEGQGAESLKKHVEEIANESRV